MRQPWINKVFYSILLFYSWYFGRRSLKGLRFDGMHPNAMIRLLLVLNAVDTLLSPPLGIYIKKV